MVRQSFISQLHNMFNNRILLQCNTKYPPPPKKGGDENISPIKFSYLSQSRRLPKNGQIPFSTTFARNVHTGGIIFSKVGIIFAIQEFHFAPQQTENPYLAEMGWD